MPSVIVSIIACQRTFQLSDPGVPRTFVEDCRSRNVHIKIKKNNSSQRELGPPVKYIAARRPSNRNELPQWQRPLETIYVTQEHE